MNNALLDKNFLTELIKQQVNSIYIDITLLDQDENIKDSLNGRATSGNINIDGKSSSRRSCNISLAVEQNCNFCQEFWTLESKFKVQIGLENNINKNYDPIIWFPAGTYLITSFSLSFSSSGITVSIQGKDKMGKLDGTFGGKITASTIFNEIEIVDSNSTYKEKTPLKEIITELVHQYGKEPYGNIIVNDLPDHGLEIQTYYGSSPLYFFLNNDKKTIFNAVKDCGNYTVKFNNNIVKLDDESIVYYNRNRSGASKISLMSDTNTYEGTFYVLKFEYGDTIGYKQTDLTYAGTLNANIDETATSVLDKIKSQLGEYEYFYDLYGNFIFQKKKNYIQGNYDLLTTDDNGKIKYNMEPFYAFEFDNTILSNISKNPVIANIKNDYVVWGTATNSNKNSVSAYARIAIDKKPTKYNSLEITLEEAEQLKKNYPEIYILEAENYVQTPVSYIAAVNQEVSAVAGEENKTEITYIVDWRELIYQMAMDYYNYHKLNNFLEKVNSQNPNCIHGITGYEQYYQDMQGKWRTLYDYSCAGIYNEDLDIEYDAKGWNIIMAINPENITFWFDFIDTLNSLQQYSVPAIGDRVFTKSDKAVKSVYYPEVPNIIFLEKDEVVDEKTFGTDYITFTYDSKYASWFAISSRGSSAIETIYSSINSNLLINETASLQTKPIYFLEPNTRVFINSDGSGIIGDYVINSISIPLQVGGLSTIQATKVNPDLIIQ